MRINRTVLATCRTIHIYLTLLGLLVLLGFGITGFTLNHEDWLGGTTPHVTETQGQTPLELIAKSDVARIVEHLRETFQVKGAMIDFDDLGDQFSVGFKSPRESWEVQIDKASGKTDIHREGFNFVAMVNNLHRGRYSGAAWSWVIDVSAALLVLACATGLILWLALPKRQKLGIGALFVGAVATLAIFTWLVPGSDAIVQLKSMPHASVDRSAP